MSVCISVIQDRYAHGKRNMKKKAKSGFVRFMLCIVYAIYSLYYIEDMQTSANVMIKQTESRSSVHLFLMLLIALLALYMVMRAVLTGKLKNSNLSIPLFVLAVWGAFSDFLNGVSFWSIAVHIGLIVLWFLTVFFMEDVVYDRKTYNLVIMFEFIIWIVTIYFSIVALINFTSYSAEIGANDASNVLNISYNILVLIPFLLQIKNRFIKNISLIISCGLIIVSMKRGSILALGLMLIIYCYIQIKRGKMKFSPLKSAAVIVIFAVAVAVVNKITDNALISRFTWEAISTGSDRDILYSAAIHDILKRNFVELLIGKGSGSSLAIIGSGVHNEILEMIFSYGIIGLLIYLWLIIRGIKLIFRLSKERSNASAIYAMSVVYIVFVGLVGTALFAHYTFHIMASIGIASNYLRSEAEDYELR